MKSVGSMRACHMCKEWISDVSLYMQIWGPLPRPSRRHEKGCCLHRSWIQECQIIQRSLWFLLPTEPSYHVKIRRAPHSGRTRSVEDTTFACHGQIWVSQGRFTEHWFWDWFVSLLFERVVRCSGSPIWYLVSSMTGQSPMGGYDTMLCFAPWCLACWVHEAQKNLEGLTIWKN